MLRLNRELAAVLMRCLMYGEQAAGRAEIESGVAKVIESNVAILKHQVSKFLSDSIILETAGRLRDEEKT